jgi:hypothetical protein
MNQSDIRGLSRQAEIEPTLIFFVGSIMPYFLNMGRSDGQGDNFFAPVAQERAAILLDRGDDARVGLGVTRQMLYVW